MYLGSIREKIDHHEENLLSMVREDENFPKLSWLFDEFYNGPQINPECSNELVHELINLKGLNSDKSLVHTIDRLMLFFSKAYNQKKIIICKSD